MTTTNLMLVQWIVGGAVGMTAGLCGVSVRTWRGFLIVAGMSILSASLVQWVLA